MRILFLAAGLATIARRQNAVGEFFKHPGASSRVGEALRGVRDIARILARLQNRLRNPRELGGVRDTLRSLPPIREELLALPGGALAEQASRINLEPALLARLEAALGDELPVDLSEGGALRSILYALRHHTVEVRFIPEWGDIPLLNHKVSHIAGLYSLDLSCSPMDGPARVIKRLEDMLLGALISLMIVPVCLAIGIAIKLTSPGPILFKQYRTGINGKRFKVYKFRSMVLPDIFIDQASPEKMYQVAGMDAAQIEAKVLQTLGVAVVGKRA